MASVEKWVGFGSAMAGVGLLWSRMPEHVHEEARYIISRLVPMAMSYFNPYEQITVSEYGQEWFRRNKMFDTVSTYLSSVCLDSATKLKAELGGNNSRDDPRVILDENQEVLDCFDGARMWWKLCPKVSKNRGSSTNIISLFPRDDMEEPRCYRLVFHKRHRQLMLKTYLPGVIRQWRELTAKDRQRLLFTNHSNERQSMWISVPYNPPATFDMLAMDHAKKVEIMDDLRAFQKGKEYHSKVGKAWKRGYLLYGPPGTGKTTMIGAMANFLDYDVYDLDLTSVLNNADLRKLFLDTTDKSIIVIEDIDAIEVELTTNRKGKKAANGDDKHVVIELSDKNHGKSKVTLSGLLNFIDGLWSACGSERIFVFTTNHFEHLDPALIRPGRMDNRIEMSYCRLDAFKVLAKNYLNITEHSLFSEIGRLLMETNTTPADVADKLMPRNGEIGSLLDEIDGEPADHDSIMLRCNRKRHANECLEGLVETLKRPKMNSATTPMEEAKVEQPNAEES